MYINPSYFFTIQKFLYFPFSASHNILKTRVFRNNAVTMRIHLPKKRPKVSLIKIKLLIFKEDFVFEYFLARIWKKSLPISKSVPSSFSICEILCKNGKCLHIGQKILYLAIFGLKFEKAIVIFKINAPKSV